MKQKQENETSLLVSHNLLPGKLPGSLFSLIARPEDNCLSDLPSLHFTVPAAVTNCCWLADLVALRVTAECKLP